MIGLEGDRAESPAATLLDAPPAFHLLAKPSGSTCNIDCTYCFFLSKEALYPNDKSRMSEATLEAYISQLLEAHRTPQVTVAWHGWRADADGAGVLRAGRGDGGAVPSAGPEGAAHPPDQRAAPRRGVVRLLHSPAQRRFGDDKRDTLTAQCRDCKVLPLCNGGCPKDRIVPSRDGEPGHNCLCAGLEAFFTHTVPLFTRMAQLIQQGRAPRDVMAWVTAEDDRRGRYEPCPCGGGRKFKFCHGSRARQGD